MLLLTIGEAKLMLALDEGLIDYVAKDSYGSESDLNALYSANVIASKAY